MRYILHIALIISILTYLFWNELPKGSFYIGNALFIFLLCAYIYKSITQSFITFVLLCLSLNNLIDELFFDNTIFQLNEFIFIIILPLIWLFKKPKNAREITSK